MSDTTLIQSNSAEEIIELENPLNGEISLIKAKDIREWELKLEQLRLRLVMKHLSDPSYQAIAAKDTEDWGEFASLIIGRANKFITVD
jgi:hypothetical protein